MHIARRFTIAGQDAYAAVAFRTATSEIRNPDGSVVFQAEGIEIPAEWSQVAADILAQKYFRKAGVPAALVAIPEDGVPSWLWRRQPDESALAALPEDARCGGETGARQVFDRMAGTWTYWGWKGGYFDAEDDARAFYDEIRLMLARQMGAPNSPQWFNTGLHWAYGIDGPAQGHWYVDYRTGELMRRPAPMSIPSRMPALSRAWPTISSTKAGSWICGCARRGSSNTAQARARISRNCAARASGCRAAGARPG